MSTNSISSTEHMEIPYIPELNMRKMVDFEWRKKVKNLQEMWKLIVASGSYWGESFLTASSVQVNKAF